MTRQPAFLIAVAILVFATGRVRAAEPAAPDLVRSGTAHEALFDVDMTDDGKGLAVGAGGAMFASSDGGKTWTQLPAATDLSLLAATITGDRQIAVGQGGVALVRDAGSAFRKVESGSTQRLLAVDMNAQGLAVAVGGFGTILESTDAGASWKAIAPVWSSLSSEGIEPHLYAVQVDDDGTVTVAGETGAILRTKLGPTSDKIDWQVLHLGKAAKHLDDASLFALEIKPSGLGYAVGQEGVVLKTTDGGSHWALLKTADNTILLSVEMLPDEVLVSSNFGLIRSRDGGQTWQPEMDRKIAGSWYSGLSSTADGGVVMVGNNGRIVRWMRSEARGEADARR